MKPIGMDFNQKYFFFNIMLYFKCRYHIMLKLNIFDKKEPGKSLEWLINTILSFIGSIRTGAVSGEKELYCQLQGLYLYNIPIQFAGLQEL